MDFGRNRLLRALTPTRKRWEQRWQLAFISGQAQKVRAESSSPGYVLGVYKFWMTVRQNPLPIIRII